MVPDFHLFMLNSSRTEVGVWEDQGKHADVMSWNQCFKIYFARRMVGFFNERQPFQSYLLQGKISGRGVGWVWCFYFDSSCFWPLFIAYHHSLG